MVNYDMDHTTSNITNINSLESWFRNESNRINYLFKKTLQFINNNDIIECNLEVPEDMAYHSPSSDEEGNDAFNQLDFMTDLYANLECSYDLYKYFITKRREIRKKKILSYSDMKNDIIELRERVDNLIDCFESVYNNLPLTYFSQTEDGVQMSILYNEIKSEFETVCKKASSLSKKKFKAAK